MKSFTGRTGKDVTKSKFKKYKKNQASTKQGWKFWDCPDKGGNIAIKSFNNSVGDATGAGTGQVTACDGGCSESLEDWSMFQDDFGRDTDTFEMHDVDMLNKQAAIEEATRLTNLEQSLDGGLTWYINDNLCSHPSIEGDIISIMCTPDLTIRNDIMSIIKEIVARYNAQALIDDATDDIIISFKSDDEPISMHEVDEDYNDCVSWEDTDDADLYTKAVVKKVRPESRIKFSQIDDFDDYDSVDPYMLNDIRDYYINNDIDPIDIDRFVDDELGIDKDQLNSFTIFFIHDDIPFSGIINAFSSEDATEKFNRFCPQCVIQRVDNGIVNPSYPYITRSFCEDMGWKTDTLTEETTQPLTYEQRTNLRNSINTGDTLGAEALIKQYAHDNNSAAKAEDIRQGRTLGEALGVVSLSDKLSLLEDSVNKLVD